MNRPMPCIHRPAPGSVLQGRRALLAAALSLPIGARAAQPLGARDLPVQPPAALPDFTFTDAEGTARRLADFEGKAFVLNFWATWCAPCVAEMPALDRLQRAVADDGILVLALSSDRGGAAQVRPFYERVGVAHLGLWLDPRGAAARAFGIRAVPTTIVVNRALQEVSRLAGPAEWDAPPMIAALRGLVG